MKKIILSLALALTSLVTTATGLEEISNKKYLYQGEISGDDITQFNHIKSKSVLHIDSIGGDEIAALQIARKIHRKEIDIVVYGRCQGACMMLFYAAKNKTVLPYAYLGLQREVKDNIGELSAELCRSSKDNTICKSSESHAVAKERSIFLEQLGIKTALTKLTDGSEVPKIIIPDRKLLEKNGIKGVNFFWFPEKERHQNHLIEIYQIEKENVMFMR